MPQSSDEHWAPDHVLLARRPLTYAGQLLVLREHDGRPIEYAPLAGMAAVEARYPVWALGPFGYVEPERDLPRTPAVFALLQSGVVRYVGATRDVARTFSSRRGLGTISRRDCQLSRREEHCRLNRLVVAEARAGRTVDLYLMGVGKRGPASARGLEQAEQIAAEIRESVTGSWHLPR
ncbi:hypothetical protein [Actinotalea sp. K2]|uniref:hypothetical protein n=1 Tax=Actinotalea sp. K2 TaxID=2939438 RepID=UPI002016DF8B|nr:hypothetical protein [Actinotalea sp. K2]